MFKKRKGENNCVVLNRIMKKVNWSIIFILFLELKPAESFHYAEAICSNFVILVEWWGVSTV